MQSLDAALDKIIFVASDFNHIPLESEAIDCAMLLGAIHHSLSPIKTLQEVARCVKKGGTIMILEMPPATIRIRQARKRALALSSDVSEICHTREEWEYLMTAADVGKVDMHAIDILSRGGWRMAIRNIFRGLEIEHIFLNPPHVSFLD